MNALLSTADAVRWGEADVWLFTDAAMPTVKAKQTTAGTAMQTHTVSLSSISLSARLQ